MSSSSILENILAVKSAPQWSLVSDDLELKVFRKALLQPEFVERMHTEEVNQYLELRHNPPSFEDQRAFIDGNLSDGSSLYLAMINRERNVVIGSIRLSEVSDFNRRCDIGIMIVDKLDWGKGYATQAISLITAYAHRELGIRRITAGCYAANGGSKAAFMKAGYTLEGELAAYWTTGTIQSPGSPISEYLLGSVWDDG